MQLRHLPGLKRTLSLADVGITAKDLKKLAEDAMKQTRLLVKQSARGRFDDALAPYTESVRKSRRSIIEQ